mgnify:FL=1|tara:strand:+ start:338 stop:514 length:177 start_codon:yes stop_codon:yes gene_type:complete
MYENSESILVPGIIVEHVDYPEWGQGQVQSCINGTVTINFQNKGKQVLKVDYEKFKVL